jgi:hypothetical protein
MVAHTTSLAATVALAAGLALKLTKPVEQAQPVKDTTEEQGLLHHTMRGTVVGLEVLEQRIQLQQPQGLDKFHQLPAPAFYTQVVAAPGLRMDSSLA